MAELEFPFPDAPEYGQLIEVADGVFWTRMPLPFSLAHINLWVLRDNDGWTIIDTGIKSDETKDHWQHIFDNDFEGRPLNRVILTHLHPDHMGLAGWLTEKWSVPLWMTQTEWLYAQLQAQKDGSNLADNMPSYYARQGVPAETANNMKKMFGFYREIVGPPPSTYRRVREKDCIMINNREWRVYIGRGHSPEHACYFCPDLNVMIGGDQLLPRITPSISVYPEEPDGNPLQLFLDSLEQFYGLPADCLILPSHELPYRGVHTRVGQLKAHHQDRCQSILSDCQSASTLGAMEITRSMFKHRELSPMDEIMALGEAVAHINKLMHEGIIDRQLNADGLYEYSTEVSGEYALTV